MFSDVRNIHNVHNTDILLNSRAGFEHHYNICQGGLDPKKKKPKEMITAFAIWELHFGLTKIWLDYVDDHDVFDELKTLQKWVEWIEKECPKKGSPKKGESPPFFRNISF